MRPLSGKLALVTGASAGIGAAIARALHGAGASLVLAARRRERLEPLARELGGAQALALDVRDAAAVFAALGGQTFDIVVPNAGVGRGMESIAAGAPEDWSEMIDTNVKGVLHVARACLPAMLAQKRGDVVLIGSVAGRQVYPGGNVYCATKHAVRALYEGLRVDAVGSGVRFTTVDPGMVVTEFSLGRFRGDAARAAAVYAGMTPLRAEDVADAVLWAITRPPHVNVGEIVLWPSDQASTMAVHRRKDAASK